MPTHPVLGLTQIQASGSQARAFDTIDENFGIVDAATGSISGMWPTGALSANMRRFVPMVNTIAAPTSGTMIVCPIWLPAGKTITTVKLVAGGTVPTASTHLWVALFNPLLGKMAQSADDTSATPLTADTKKTFTLVSPPLTTGAGIYYIGFLETVSAGSMPTFSGVSLLTAIAAEAPVFRGNSNAALTTTAPTTATAPDTTNAGAVPYLWVT